MIAATPLLAFGFSAPHSSPPLCEPGVDMPDGDLSPTPIEASAERCHELCTANASCTLFSWHSHGECDPNGCALAGGCCRLKGVEVNGVAPKSDKCACSGYVRVPSSTFVPSGTPGPSAKNVLYILVDDLRPELAAYNQTKGHSPNISALAAGGTVFDNAYCQIAVCSPSRMSFLTGRRPDHSRVVNFIDHFRQADCGLNEGGVAYHGETFKSVKIGGCEWAGAAPCGGSGDCCSICSEHEGCAFWSYAHANSSCMLKTRRGDAAADEGVVSGARGSFGTRASWVSLPQHFRNAGWLALSSGKIFHTEEGGSGNVRPELNGPGMPPNEDPPSWSDGLSMQRVNDVANMWPCDMDSPTSSPDACAVDADVDGFVAHPTTTKALCDRVIADDAVLKLRLAAANLERTQQPFFMAAGFRKPHLAFRFPAPFLQLVAGDVAAHGALSATAPPIAHHDADPQPDPYTPIDAALASKWRQHYRAAIAWVDSQIGRVLAELEARQLVPSTLVALHSDHGWSLGEHGEWQASAPHTHTHTHHAAARTPCPSIRRATPTALVEILQLRARHARASDRPRAVAAVERGRAHRGACRAGGRLPDDGGAGRRAARRRDRPEPRRRLARPRAAQPRRRGRRRSAQAVRTVAVHALPGRRVRAAEGERLPLH